MTPGELATFLLVFCLNGNGVTVSDKCVDYVVNCAVGKAGAIKDQKVKECLLEAPKDDYE